MAAATMGAGGCAVTRNELGLNDGACYVALPAAKAAVHGQGSLLGVRLRRVSDLRARRMDVDSGLVGGQRLCLVAFKGSFRAEQVRRPRVRPSGTVAVVVLTYPDSRLIGTFILHRLPVPFGHSHLGV
jgi:hypothetical protein